MSTKQGMNIDQMLNMEGQKSADRVLIWGLLFALAVIPLLTRAAIFPFFSPVITGTSLDTGMKADIFTYYKFIWLMLVVAFAICVFVYKMLAKGYQIQPSYINFPLLIMFVFVLLSGVFAEYKTLAMFGQYNRHEGTLTYLGYFILFFIAANILYTEKKMDLLIYALYPLLFINAGLGLAYFYGYDILNNAFFQGILLPAGLSKESLNGFVSSTINNPNYVSGIAGMLVVLFLTKALLSGQGKKKALDIICAVVAFALLLSSLSTSGFVTFVVLLPLIFVMVLLRRNKKAALLPALVILIAFPLVFFAMNSHNSLVWKESLGFFFGTSSGAMEGKNSAGEAIGWKDFVQKHSPFSVHVASAATESGNADDEFNLPPQGWAAGTGRVYIWSKTLELIQANPFLGYGMDTLAYYFPQDDPYKNSGINDPNTIVDKPHNMYIGLAFGSGVIMLLAFLVLIVRHAWQHVLLFKRRIQTERQAILASLFAGWCAYLVQAMFNDSVIGTGFIFWILFGVSVSLLREERTES
ncbi:MULTISPECIES: O-antigen ligase family protein [Aneurinibacillus]|uniref:O-antigen ligase family protein n=1 Tax=Aneurinibacillus thermoaerophilus TaxID=143495 RepID=A0ABX8YA53_ANETH|nr:MULTISPECIES: O-antigen ligase family protein [Aneurinibacillus]AMA71707.1 hypothetical protein ACH33_01860 [Aneurinibacillus sp. XH2]MED0738680.1 O-antigen ligase family protein [Aneurinibacillus thermoaerophilus]MED0757797.1 O-antigen ligase family protein [Aneurinibacillus thermoaerophilus]MED0761519.1 O-antigen ligase family protein [Aneurinibacillus thermoaerophilus]QYY42539.1 O-antigen ligase family protein [Aneurinibacillus thermoaerophilus]